MLLLFAMLYICYCSFSAFIVYWILDFTSFYLSWIFLYSILFIVSLFIIQWLWIGWYRKADTGNIDFLSFAMLLFRYRPHFWRLGCHLQAGTGRDPKNLRQEFFPDEYLCLVHEFSWWSLDRNAVGQANDVSAVEGDWLILDHAGRLKFQSRLVATGAIVIGRDDGLPDTSLPVTIQMRSKASWWKTTGRANYWGRAQWIWGVGLLERSRCRLVNDENGEGAQGPDIPVVTGPRTSAPSPVPWNCSVWLIITVSVVFFC